MTAIMWLGVADLARQIALGALSPVDVVEAYLKRIREVDGRFRSYIAVFEETALDAARTADRLVREGRPLGSLHGVPIAVKDVLAVKGSPTTAGSRFLVEPASADATVIARLREAGAIILGKLNAQEFAYGAEGTNPHYGTPWNPWDTSVHRLPGGSSSGAAVAVAGGLAPAAIGSDTGGSIRMPSACCGIVGIKPTYGRVSRAGLVPLSWSLDHVGPMARTVRDAAAILAAIAGHDPLDPSTSTRPAPDYLQGLEGSSTGLRIGIIREYLEEAETEARSAVRAAAHLLQGLGCDVDEVTIPSVRFAAGASYAILAPEAMSYHRPLLARHAREYDPETRQRILVGHFLSATDYINGQRARKLIRAEVDEALARVDCLLAPTTPIPAPPVAATEVTMNGSLVAPRWALSRFTRLFNVTGHPVVAAPCGFSRDGLPLSIQLVGRPFDEVTILRVAHVYEREAGWYRRRAPAA